MIIFIIYIVELVLVEVKEVFEIVEKDNNGYIFNLIGFLVNVLIVLEVYCIVGVINCCNSLIFVECEVV